MGTQRWSGELEHMCTSRFLLTAEVHRLTCNECLLIYRVCEGSVIAMRIYISTLTDQEEASMSS